MSRYLVGTLFEQEEIKQKTRFENMKAKDDKGHMRWEGAFTGGFTAGYRNTCGSKDGWAPSTFVSSRDKRAQTVKQDIRAYMDDDDLVKHKPQNTNIRVPGVYGETEAPENDQFLNEYTEMFTQLVKKKWKQQTEEQKQKRIEDNRISFDYTKPLQDKDEYLKEIVDNDPITKKRRPQLNAQARASLKDLFDLHDRLKLNKQCKMQIPEVPADYDPYRRMTALANARSKVSQAQHKTLNHDQRSNMLGEKMPASAMLGLGGNHFKDKFVKGQTQEQAPKELQYFMMDPKQQKRYDTFVLEAEGKIIGADSDLPWEQAQKEKTEFQKLYDKQKCRQASKHLPKTEPENKKQVTKKPVQKLEKLVRTQSAWRPSKLLCKRFGLLLPYTIDRQQG